MKLSSCALLLLGSCWMPALAQFSEPEMDIPVEEKYLYPIKPGQLGSLAGNMGELRSNHFHSGLDIRTNNEAGYHVHASKSGYISRVSVSGSGYGNVIFIKHPDGNTTLYAHLQEFVEPIASLVLQEQYRRNTFDINLNFGKGEYVVRQGETIGISGNTGSSGGPHLHFDIRDKNNHALDPLQFGFNEIIDNTPPTVQKIALITLDKDSRINDQFGRFEFYVTQVGNEFKIKYPIKATGRIGVEIKARDKFIPHGQFFGGVKNITVLANNNPIFNQSVDFINTDETRMIHTFIDYKDYIQSGSRFYKLFIQDGNTLPFYTQSPSRGFVEVRDSTDVQLEILLSDKFNNKAKASLTLQAAKASSQVKNLPAISSITSELMENVLQVTTRKCPNDYQIAKVYSQGNTTHIAADYVNENQAVYLIDLRKVLPDSVVTCSETLVTHLASRISPGIEYTYYGDWVDINFPATALYDTLYLHVAKEVVNDEEQYTIGDITVPIHERIFVSIKPSANIQVDEKVSMYKVNKRTFSHYGGEWKNGRYHFTTRNFGTYTLLRDSIPPTIQAKLLTRSGVRFRISDNLSGISKYEATINGQWLLMHYDEKTRTIWSQPKEKNAIIKGQFQLLVTDNAGNTETFNYTIP